MPAYNVNLDVNLPANGAAMKCKATWRESFIELLPSSTWGIEVQSIIERTQTVSLNIFSTTETNDSSNSSETMKIINSHETEEKL